MFCFLFFFFKLMVLTCFLKESQQGWVIGKGKGTAQWRNGSPLCLWQQGASHGDCQMGVSGARGVKDAGGRGSDGSWGVSRTVPFQQSAAEETKWWRIILINYGAFPRKDVQWSTIIGKNRGCATAPRRSPCHPWGAGSYELSTLGGTAGEQGVQPAAGMLAGARRDTPHWAH